MATSTNFGWAEPDNSSLVKNGASDIRTLGNAIDVSLWNASKTINPVLNSNMSVWQRGTSISVSASSTPYTADRWQITTQTNQAATVSRQATSDTTNLPFIQYCARVQRNSGQTGTSTIQFGQSFESINSIPYAGKAITFSFYARAGANYSASSSILGIDFVSGTGTDQNRLTAGYTGNANVFSSSATLTTTWQRFTFTGTVPATSTEFAPLFLFVPTGTASTNDYFEITGVQIDLGSTALPYRPNGQTYQAELAACQRYYFRNTGSAVGSAYAPMNVGGYASSTTNIASLFTFPVTMRTLPSSVDYSTLQVLDSGGSAYTVVSMAISQASPSTANCDVTVVGATASRYAFIRANNSTSAYVGFSAEL